MSDKKLRDKKMKKRFICVMKFDKTCSLSAVVTNVVEEKLFIPFCQYEKFAQLKNGTSGNLFDEW